MAIDPYVYPDTNVLRNRFDLRDADELARREAEVTAAALARLREQPLAGAYDLAHLQAFHRELFGTLYPWAGELRTVALGKDNTVFALPPYIEPYLHNVFAQLQREHQLQGLDREQFLDRLTHYHAEINAAHPFREGNGRTERAFLAQLSDQAGHHIAWERLDRQHNIDASIASHRGDNRPLRQLLDQLLEPARQRDMTHEPPTTEHAPSEEPRSHGGYGHEPRGRNEPDLGLEL